MTLAPPLALAGALLLLWLVSVAMKDSSLVDIFWGLAFATVAWVTAFTVGFSSGALLLCAVTTLWALRLSIYLAWRNLGHGEDVRYQAMRANAGPSWWWRSFFQVFVLQGALAWIISLPLQLGMLPLPPINPWVAPGLAVFAVGLFFETVGDLQLAAFKKDPASKGQVMDRGLWKYTRHPNYFGDFCVWWGLYFTAVALGAPVWTVLSPAIMSFLLMRVSGVPLLEKGLRARRPGYEEYVRRTSSFFPRAPRPPA